MSLTGKKVWYNMKFDQRLLIPFENDDDVVSVLRGNDSHAYLYIGGIEGPRAHPIIVREEGGHEQCYCEGTVAVGVQAAAADNGKELLTENVNGAAVAGKLLRVDGVEEAVRPSAEGVKQLAAAYDFGNEDSSHSKSGSESNDDGETVVLARSGVEAEDYIRRRTI